VLEGEYQARLRDRLERDLEVILGDGHSQARVERVLGVSPGYLSKLKAGRRNPSIELTVVLRVLARGLVAKDPAGRLTEVEEMFKADRKRAAG